MTADGHITLRPVRPDDCDQLWRWVNDPVVRASSFSCDPIPLDAHRHWFAARLENLRFDLAGDVAEVDVTVDPSHRGQGIGAVVIARGVAALFERPDVAIVRALVKRSNRPSIAAFRRAGFEEMSETLVNDCPTTVLTAGRKEHLP
jgi:UDP-2,4-diacetamido-2,4,6-trideoxy-beta-L-altropyranose hydrolase